MSSTPCLSGGAGRAAYGGFDLDIVKSSSTICTSTRTSNSNSPSSPSSTISESINSPLVISTRKPRTPRKRPNQTYNEAAALLSTVYPNIFSTKNLRKPRSTRGNNLKTSKNNTTVFDMYNSEEYSELLPLSPSFNGQLQPRLRTAAKLENSNEKPMSRLSSMSPSNTIDSYEEDIDTESILDEEMDEGGIDSIMGSNNDNQMSSFSCSFSNEFGFDPYSCYQNPMGFDFFGKFDFGFGLGGGIKPLRVPDEWWTYPSTTVDVLQISPRVVNTTVVPVVPDGKKSTKSKKKKKIVVPKDNSGVVVPLSVPVSVPEVDLSLSLSSSLSASLSLGLKLSYGEVLDAWSDKGCPFSDEVLGASELSESDAIARLAQIDLFSENGGLREASMLRYKEKRRSRLFSKKIRYEVRKVNADRRPRMKGRFVRRPMSAVGLEMKRN